MNTPPSVTRFTALKPGRLSKRFALTGDTLIKEGGGNLTDGIAERITVASVADFAALLQTLTPKQALAYGINGHDRARVVASFATPPGDTDLPVINRTRDHFTWPEGAGLLMMDHDPTPNSPPLDMDGLRAAVSQACPALADAPMVWRPSASSCIYTKDGTELRGISGQRLYVPVLEAADIPRAGDVLFKRLWLAGLGRYEISKSGALLARSVIDASVFQPERLDFAGGADCGRGLEQRLPEPVLFNEDAPYLDSRSALPDLTTEEEARLASIRSDLAAMLEPERLRVRENWIAERVAAGLAKLPEARREVDRPRLEATYRQAAEGGRLGLDFELVIVKKGARVRKVMPVFEVLNQRSEYHESTACDPLEPDYPDGQSRLVGWLNLRAPEPYLQSQAHGGIRYWLGDEPQARNDEPPPLDEGYFDAVAADTQQGQMQAPARGVTIQLTPGALPETVDEAEAALCAHEPNHFQRSGQLVRWCISPAETVRGIARPGGAIAILNQDPDYLLDRLNRLIRWEKWDSKKEDYKTCNAPRTIATTLLARRGHWKARPLVAVISAPTLRPDGTILDQPGYDESTGLLLVSNGVEFEPIPAERTREQALSALEFIKDEVLAGFPFAAAHDRSAALSAILTACIRHSLKNAPMHTFAAPVMASGKSLLADACALIATGHPATVMSFTDDADEMRKRVLSVLMQGDLVVNLDNVEEPLASQTLCSVLTQENFTDRILGVNRTATAPTLACWLATGNNLQISGDLTTRVVPCNLDPKVERPEERTFERNLYEWIPANRPRLIRAALTVLRAYVCAGRPKQSIKNFARFEDWSGLVRSALVWLGESDPLIGRESLEDGDPVRVKLRALLGAWWHTFKTCAASSKEAVNRANETQRDESGDEVRPAQALFEVLSEHFAGGRAGGINANGIGYFLRQYAGRIESGARFEAYGGNAARACWRVVILDEKRFFKISTTEKNTRPGETSQQSQRSQPCPDRDTPIDPININELGKYGPGLGCQQGWDAFCESQETGKQEILESKSDPNPIPTPSQPHRPHPNSVDHSKNNELGKSGTASDPKTHWDGWDVPPGSSDFGGKGNRNKKQDDPAVTDPAQREVRI